eukprot:3071-Pelagococcus_subviridis.AAC.1
MSNASKSSVIPVIASAIAAPQRRVVRRLKRPRDRVHARRAAAAEPRSRVAHAPAPPRRHARERANAPVASDGAAGQQGRRGRRAGRFDREKVVRDARRLAAMAHEEHRVLEARRVRVLERVREGLHADEGDRAHEDLRRGGGGGGGGGGGLGDAFSAARRRGHPNGTSR